MTKHRKYPETRTTYGGEWAEAKEIIVTGRGMDSVLAPRDLLT